MRLKRCENGHLYIADESSSCPICGRYGTETAPLPECRDPQQSAGAFPGEEAGDGENLPGSVSAFRIAEMIGAGSTGRVYRAEIARDYAVKIVRSEENGLARARREYTTGRAFSEEPHIIRYLKYYEENGTAFIVQELARPLEQRYREKQPTVREVLSAALDLCDALAAVRRMGFQHYDVKPWNLFWCGGTVKLGDFSHCRPCTPGQPYRHLIGTRLLAAPEIVNGGVCSGREDICSFGICLYMLLSGGRHPFIPDDRLQPVRLPEDTLNTVFLHPALTAIVSKASAWDPADRYAEIEEAAQDLRRFMEEAGPALDELIPFSFRTSNGRTISPLSPATYPDEIYTTAMHSGPMRTSPEFT
ncbi:MAG: serine/threonine protein kinase [Clostridia bacterium]|nr:serine/threonine protein kinase [Clostridia bacterium]